MLKITIEFDSKKAEEILNAFRTLGIFSEDGWSGDHLEQLGAKTATVIPPPSVVEVSDPAPEKKSKRHKLSPEEKKEKTRLYNLHYREKHPYVGKRTKPTIHQDSWGNGKNVPKEVTQPIEYAYCANPKCTLGHQGKFVKGAGVIRGKLEFHNYRCAEEFASKGSIGIQAS
jgi:hypothetical protein